MPSASLAAAARPSSAHVHPDMARIASLSVAIALNLAVLMVALRPLAPRLLDAPRHADAIPIKIIESHPLPIPKPPPPIDLPHRPISKPVPVTHAPPKPPVAPVTVSVDEGRIAVPPVSTPTVLPTSDTATSTGDAGPGLVDLAYRASPLKFPVQALRQQLHGTVLLRVLVDEQGKPLQVEVEKTSGSKVLDKSACDQVLAAWLFQPAMAQGQPVKAWARVPVSFQLQAR